MLQRLTIVFALLTTAAATAEDWPMERRDLRRSGITPEQLDASRLREQWTVTAAQPPSPAWPSPARWDAYASLAGMKSMRNYDPVFHPVVVGTSVFLASNADDTLRCLDLATGDELWRYTAGGPIRIAPTVTDHRVYIGSDDGAATCLDASSGNVLWTYTASPTKERFLNNGRAISFWPVRTGVLVDEGTAYFGAGMFPWRSSYLCAVNAESGAVKFEKDLGNGLTLEGGLLASEDHILVPQGRIAPRLYRKSDGGGAGALKGGGGSFVLLLEDGSAMHGPGNKAPGLSESRASDKEKIASFDGGLAVVVHEDRAYLASDHSLTAISRLHGGVEWTTPLPPLLALILAGDTLFAGSSNEVFALNADDGTVLWRGEVNGRAYGLAVANKTLLVSTDRGDLTVFREQGSAQRRPSISLPDQTDVEVIATHPSPKVRPERTNAILDRWVFHADRVEVVQPDPDDPRLERRVRNMIEGGRPAPLAGSAVILELDPGNDRGEEALRLDGSSGDPLIATSILDDNLPRGAFSIEAWVRIDEPQSWGAILSAQQDNGAYEKGILLGYRDNTFGACLNAENGPDKLTWIVSPHPYTIGQWHHVVTTYDGTRFRLYVDGNGMAESTEQTGLVQYPDDAFYQMGSYHDNDEHFKMTGAINEVRLYNAALTPKDVTRNYRQKARSFPPPPDHKPKEKRITIARGPILNVLSPTTARVEWWTDKPEVSHIDLERQGVVVKEVKSNRTTREHSLELDGLQPNTLYDLHIHHREGRQTLRTRAYDLDTHFDFSLPPLPLVDDQPAPPLPLAKRSEGGIAVVFGAGSIARDLALTSPLSVIAVEGDPDRAAAARTRWLDEGLYGHRLSILEAPLGATNLPSRIADVVAVDSIVGDVDAILAAEASRLVQPHGTLFVDKDVSIALLPATFVTAGELRDGYRLATGTPIPGAQPWQHMYGNADNSAYAGETLADAEQFIDLTLQWAGRPGPRYQSDRGNRKPSPLAADGRLFVQGLNRVIAIDAYNGTVLWEVGIPELQRFNIPRDCSNWCTDGSELFLATGDRLRILDAATGRIDREFEVPRANRGFDWGYVARQGDLLLGSSVASEAPFTEWWGGQHWYDAKDGPLAAKVCSDELFAMDPATGEKRWSRSQGLIVNSTISVTDDAVFFLECTDTELRAGETRRLDGDAFWNSMRLVALDLNTGEPRWERNAKPEPGTSLVALVAAEGKLILQTSFVGKFAVYVMNQRTGKIEWRSTFDWETDHHGKHLSRPLVVDGSIYLRPLTIDLATGDVTATAFPGGHQCGTYTASKNALFLRAGDLAMWDRDSLTTTKLQRMRPDCWISTIPAEGMLLSPEGGGGCSCGSWMETSMGLLPKRSGAAEPTP